GDAALVPIGVTVGVVGVGQRRLDRRRRGGVQQQLVVAQVQRAATGEGEVIDPVCQARRAALESDNSAIGDGEGAGGGQGGVSADGEGGRGGHGEVAGSGEAGDAGGAG